MWAVMLQCMAASIPGQKYQSMTVQMPVMVFLEFIRKACMNLTQHRVQHEAGVCIVFSACMHCLTVRAFSVPDDSSLS